jgi:hypothetical protein
MLLSLLLLSPLSLAPLPAEGSLLATVPEDAYVLVHCQDFAAFRARAESNDWYQLLGSSQGEPLMRELAHDFQHELHCEIDEVLRVAAALEGELVLFDTGTVAGFATKPPASRDALVSLMRDWLPEGNAAARRTLELGGGKVELVAWPDEPTDPDKPGVWTGRAGHFAAFVDHPRALALYSGDDSTVLMATVKECVAGLGVDGRVSPTSIGTAYLEAGGGKGGGIELFVDFTPLVDDAEAGLKKAVDGFLPDPSSLLGLENGTWMHASADVFAGTRVDCRARVHLPEDSVASQLADTFKPLPRTLPADLPKGVWSLFAVNWDLKLFYKRARAAYEEAGQAEDLQVVDANLAAAQGMAGVDPVTDVLNQLAGDFTVYFVEPPEEGNSELAGIFPGLERLLSLGVYAGLVDGAAFLTAFRQLVEVGRLESVFEVKEVAGVEAYTIDEDEFDGGMAFLPRTFAVAPTHRVLERSLLALTNVEGASLAYGSPMQAAIDENANACFLMCMEMTPLRAFLLPEVSGDVRVQPQQEREASVTRDPFDSQLIGSVRRTPDGFELRLQTR